MTLWFIPWVVFILVEYLLSCACIGVIILAFCGIDVRVLVVYYSIRGQLVVENDFWLFGK